MSKNHSLLASVPLFAQCSKKELSLLDSLSTAMDFAEGSVLIKQGSIGKEFLLLVSGTAEVVRDGVVLEKLGAGSPVGELSLLDGAVRAATVTTTSPVTALVLSVSEFESALDASPPLARALLHSTAHRLRLSLESATV